MNNVTNIPVETEHPWLIRDRVLHYGTFTIHFLDGYRYVLYRGDVDPTDRPDYDMRELGEYWNRADVIEAIKFWRVG